MKEALRLSSPEKRRATQKGKRFRSDEMRRRECEKLNLGFIYEGA